MLFLTLVKWKKLELRWFTNKSKSQVRKLIRWKTKRAWETSHTQAD